MRILLCFFGYLSAFDSLPVRPQLVLESIPEDAAFFLQYPVGVAIDPRGRYLVLDGMARVAFVWNAEGRFLGHFGNPGNGPGEFSFSEVNTRQAQIDAHGDRIYIYESGKRVLHIFDSDFSFIEAKTLKEGVGQGRTRFFGLTDGDTILMHHQNYAVDVPTSRLMLYNHDLQPTKTLMTYRDSHYRSHKEESGVIWTIRVFSPQLFLFSDSFRGRFLAGDGELPEFDVFNANGEKIETVQFNKSRDPVTDLDKEEFLEQDWFKSIGYYRAEFPEYFSYYETIFPIEDRGYLVFRTSSIARRVTGLVIDRAGNTVGPFRYRCGENGGLYGAAGRIIAVNTDESGDYQIAELRIPTDETD